MKSKVIELAGPAKKKSVSIMDDIDPVEEMEKLGKQMMLDLQNNSVVQIKKQREFRTSGLPFCPIVEFLRDAGVESYAKSHYTSTGTAIHETIQSWLAVSPFSNAMIYGSWECTGCGKVKLNQFVPKKPCSCEFIVSTTPFHRGWPKHWTYKEVEYNYKGLTGHIDMIIHAPVSGYNYVFDFKTTELAKKKLRWAWKEDKVSSPSYVAQIRTYSTILDLEHGLPIRGWMLINTERGMPIKTLKDFHTQVAPWSRKHSLRWQKVLDLSVANNKRLQKLETAVEKQDKADATTQLKTIIQHRPCHDEASYNASMQYGFYNSKCPKYDICIGGSAKAIRNSIIADLGKKE